MSKAKSTKNKGKKDPFPTEYKIVNKTTNKDVNLIADGLSSFYFTLQGVLTHGPKSKSKAPIKNLVFSPFCLYSSLAALKLGTSGKTGKELEKILDFPSDSSVLRSGFKSILPSLQSSKFPPEFTLHMASRIFVSEGVKIGKEFLEAVENTFGENVTILTVDFGSKEAAVKEINKWASSATGNLVQNAVTKKTLEREIVEKNDKDSQLEILIVSAVYFKGFWNMDFPKLAEGTFNSINGKPFQVQMMHRYYPIFSAVFKELDATAFALHYKDDRLCMIFFIPRETNGLEKIEMGLKNSPSPPSNMLKVINGKFNKKATRLDVPKFKVESTVDLTEPLKKAGLVKIFTPGTDFSSVTSTKEGAKVFKVVQKVVFESDEKGTPTPMIREQPPVITFNNLASFIDDVRLSNPFYFQIVDKLNDIVLLAGAYTNPESK